MHVVFMSGLYVCDKQTCSNAAAADSQSLWAKGEHAAMQCSARPKVTIACSWLWWKAVGPVMSKGAVVGDYKKPAATAPKDSFISAGKLC